jgi:hypothetical protein
MIESIKPYQMITAERLLELRADLEAQLAEIISLAPNSESRFHVARFHRDLTAAIIGGATDTPVCNAEAAAKILGVSIRQATKLALSGRVKASQSCKSGPWVFDVRSCREYSATKRRAACWS